MKFRLMKFNSRFFFRLLMFTSVATIISYTMFQNFAFSNFETYTKDTSIIAEPDPEPNVPDYKQILSAELSQFKDKIDKKAKRYRINGSVIVAYKDQILYEQEFGYKNPITKEPMQPGLSYQLASVSKQFTAASILRLQEKSLLDIDDSASDYLPGFKFENVSIRDLLKHRSGLWNYMYLTEQYWKDDDAPNNLEVVDLINTHAPRLNFPSGRYFSYSNTGYVVLGAIVEAVSKMPIGEFIEEEFLLPLCLDATFVEKTKKNNDFIVDGYQAYGRSFIKLPPGYHNGAIGDKGIYASPKDLYVWFKDLKNGNILSEESVDLMFGRDEGGKNKRYGMGFRLEEKAGESIIFHNGLWDGFRNGLEYHPNQDLVIIVMTHTQNKRKHYFQNALVKAAKAMIESAETRSSLEQNEPELML